MPNFKISNFFIFIGVICTLSPFVHAQTIENNFYDDERRRYRGWIWFEQKKLENEQRQKQHKELAQNINPDEAKEELERFKEEMDDKRAIMMTRPTAETVRDYMEMEAKMWEDAFALEKAHREAKFKYPHLFDKAKEPTNVHAVKFKRNIDAKAKEEKVESFAKEFDLVLFSKANCSYCHEFAPALKNFSEKYGFNTEEISMEGPMTGLFNGKHMPALGKVLGIEVTPTVVAVSKDGKHAFELIRGYVTVAEMEEYAELASSYAKGLKNRKNKK